MSDQPHSLLVTHYVVPAVTHGQLLNGYAPRGCLACAEGPPLRCWCGGEVGPRDPGDGIGLGCLEVIEHDWRSDEDDEQFCPTCLAGTESSQHLAESCGLDGR